VSYGEPFQPTFLLGNPSITIFENPKFFLFFKYFRNFIPLFFVKQFIFKKYPAHIRAVGFKIFYEHAHIGYLQNVWAHLAKDRSLKIIHLQRKNMLHSYISLQTALKTGDFISFIPRYRNDQVKVTLDYQACKNYFLQVETWQETYNHHFSEQSIIHIDYEHLCQNPSKELNKIQKFLGVPIRKLSSPLKKQSLGTPWKNVINYDELKEQFSKSRWTHFF